MSLDLFLSCLSQPGKSKTSVAIGCPRQGPLEDASVRWRQFFLEISKLHHLFQLPVSTFH